MADSVLTNNFWGASVTVPAVRNQQPVVNSEPRQPVVVRPPAYRDYAAARIDRLTSAWRQSTQSADGTLRMSLPVLRNRSRELAENNDYVAGYLELLSNKVIGARGIKLQSKVKGGDGRFDREANLAIETAFAAWGKRGVCDVTGRLSWVELQRLCLNSVARDGEVFVRIVKQRNINRFHFALQVIEADMVPVDKNDQLSNGNTIRMGVELNQFDKPVAYHVLERHPGNGAFGITAGKTIRIPADEMLHLYRQLRPGQTRGIPWTSSVMTRLHHMGAYEEAAIINARTGASKMGFFTRGLDAADMPGEYDSNGNLINEVEPGSLETLPKGYDFKPFDPAYPSNEYDPFIKRQLKGASCGRPGASYADLSNDLESVSFSSIRTGTINARDSYRVLQQLLIDQLCNPVFEGWLESSLIFGLIVVVSTKRGPNAVLSVANFEKYNAAQFVGRGWDWVDPYKDQLSNTEGLGNRTTTRSAICAEQGNDFEDILADLAREKELADQYGIDLEQQPTVTAPAAPVEE